MIRMTQRHVRGLIREMMGTDDESPTMMFIDRVSMLMDEDATGAAEIFSQHQSDFYEWAEQMGKRSTLAKKIIANLNGVMEEEARANLEKLEASVR